MFSGIIEAVAPIGSAREVGAIKRVRIKKPRAWELSKGQSISVDGICSTVVSSAAGSFDVEYMPETLRKTTAVNFARSGAVNLERSLTLGALLDGHIVQGHVDARGRVVAIVEVSRAKEIIISIPQDLMPLIALHGSIAINGVSLTVARRGRASITVGLIPHTLRVTNLGGLEVGSEVNIETDLLARYLATRAESATVTRNAKKRARKKA